MDPNSLPRQNLRTILIHATFWIGYFVLLVFGFSSRMEYETALAGSLLILTPQVLLVYLHMEFFVPSFLMSKKYAEFAFFLILTLVVSYLILDFINSNFFTPEDVFRPSGRFRQFDRPPGHRPFNPARGITFLSFLVTVALLLLSTAYKASQIAFKKDREASELKSQKLDAELKFLKSQINPHFLFNSLNNVYTLSKLKSDSAPEMILKLSEILRYLLYDCSQDKVALGKEIAYIRNYIELQKLKDQEVINIKADFSGVDEKLMIAPMLFIPYIENSFKHSKFEDLTQGWIQMSLRQQDHELTFEISNSVPPLSFPKDRQSGIGLDNVRRRLELLYPDKHNLNMSQSPTDFSVVLKIVV